MAQGFFMNKPQTVQGLQWTGDNYQEVRDWVGEFMPITDNGDGSLTVGGGWYPPNALPLNGWVTQSGVVLPLDTYQEVPSADVYYVVE